MEVGQAIVLTKAIGTGSLLAAAMRMRADGRHVHGASGSPQRPPINLPSRSDQPPVNLRLGLAPALPPATIREHDGSVRLGVAVESALQAHDVHAIVSCTYIHTHVHKLNRDNSGLIWL